MLIGFHCVLSKFFEGVKLHRNWKLLKVPSSKSPTLKTEIADNKKGLVVVWYLNVCGYWLNYAKSHRISQ